MGETKLYVEIQAGLAQLCSELSNEGKEMAMSSFALQNSFALDAILKLCSTCGKKIFALGNYFYIRYDVGKPGIWR